MRDLYLCIVARKDEVRVGVLCVERHVEWEDGGVQGYTGDENGREHAKQRDRWVHVCGRACVYVCDLLLLLSYLKQH